MYFILKGGALWFTTTHPETFHYYDGYWVNNDGAIKQYNEESHQKHKAQKAQIKKELMRVAWHPSKWWDWCVPEDEKGDTANCFASIGPPKIIILYLMTGCKKFDPP